MFKCFMNSNNMSTMNACACAPVSASVCSCAANQSANSPILRLMDTIIAVSFFVIANLAAILINEIIIDDLALLNFRHGLSRA